MMKSLSVDRAAVALLMLLSVLILAPPPALADDTFTPVYHPTMNIEPCAAEIEIDGVLDDAGWQGAGVADNFAEHNPGDQTKPPVDTKAWITYNSEYLYVAFICYDDPATIRASLCDRDQNVGSDDNVALLIDTYGDASRSYELFVNPYGVQSDALHTSRGGEDFSYDLIWKSAATVTASGYQVEMAIPFTSLRFPNQEAQTWKIDFWRNHPRDFRRQYSWAAYDRDDPCWACKWGTVTGIRDVQPGKGIEILPSVVAFQSGALSGNGIDSPFEFDNTDPDGEFSIGAGYSVTSDIMLEGTVNPDFSQIEADAAQIDVNSTFALFYPERRPFFQEGSDLFNSIFNVAYTRTINDPLFAGKMTARMNRTSVAYLVARDEHSPIILPFEESSRYLLTGKSTSNLLRARHTFGENSQIGFIATDRRLDGGGSGSVLSGDMDFTFAKNIRLEWQVVATHTEEPDDTLITFDARDSTFNSSLFDNGKHTAGFDGESFWGHAYCVALSRNDRNSYVEVSYFERSPTYRADVGFQPKNDQRSGSVFSQYSFRFDEGLIESIVPSFTWEPQWNYDGDRKANEVSISLELSLRAAQLSTHSRYEASTEVFSGIEFNDLWMLHSCFHSRPSNLLACGGSVNYGHNIARRELVKGKDLLLTAWADLKPIDRMLLETSLRYNRSERVDNGEELFEGYIAWTRLGLQLTRQLSFRLVTQYNEFHETWDVDPLVTYRLNPFSVFYLGTTYDYRQYNGLGDDGCGVDTRLASRQFFMKLQYLFQM